MRFHISLLITGFILTLHASGQKTLPLTSYVNPFVGTGAHGHTYPGATLPFGMVQLSPDTRLEGWDGCSGYHYSDSIIYGFSHTHLQGTGVSDYGDILFMPTNGKTKKADAWRDAYKSNFSHKSESASPGYYKVKLEDYNIEAQLTATERTGIHHYKLQPKDTCRLFIDMMHRDELLYYDIQTIGDTVVYGYRVSKAWAEEQHTYFYAVFSKPFVAFDQLMQISTAPDEFGNMTTTYEEVQIFSLLFAPDKKNELTIKVGISGVDVEGAKRNLWTEAKSWDFNTYKKNANDTWEKQLKKLPIVSNDETHLKNYYTALYHCFTTPNLWSDVDGRYRGFYKNIKQNTSSNQYTVFSLWDTFRALHPLFTAVEKERTGEFINSFLSIYDDTFNLPVWELAANETNCMIGYHSVSVIADAYAKGIRNFDTNKALEAMVATSLNSEEKQDYYNLGFVPSDKYSESVSKTLEFAYNDWCIAQFASMIGDEGTADEYFERANNWKNLFDPETKFFRPRRNGGFPEPFDPYQVDFNFTEANAWQYRMFVPHDIETLIDYHGGKSAFRKAIDDMFNASTKTTGREQADITGLIGQYVHGNEPSHHMVSLYNYTDGNYTKAQEMTQRIMKEMYQPTPEGLCGNEDCGQMSAWYVLASHNLYSTTPGAKEWVQIGPPDTTFNRMNIRSSIAPRSKSNSGSFLALPIIKAEKGTFKDSLLVELSHLEKNVSLNAMFTTPEGKTYSKQGRRFYITESGILTVSATAGERISKDVQASFIKRNSNATIKLTHQPDPQYPGDAEDALLDELRGSNDFRTGHWQGFKGVPLEAIVDLGKNKMISSISLSCLRDIKSWIWYPESIEFYVSKDGKEYFAAGFHENDELDNYFPQNMEFTSDVNMEARYVKIIARPLPTIPSWHLGAGEKAWIFADEIIIR